MTSWHGEAVRRSTRSILGRALVVVAALLFVLVGALPARAASTQIFTNVTGVSFEACADVDVGLAATFTVTLKTNAAGANNVNVVIFSRTGSGPANFSGGNGNGRADGGVTRVLNGSDQWVWATFTTMGLSKFHICARVTTETNRTIDGWLDTQPPASLTLADPLPVDCTAGCSGGGGSTTLAAADHDALNLIWYGVWALVGLTFVVILAPRFYAAFRTTHGV